MNTKKEMEGLSPRRLRNLAAVLGTGALLSIIMQGLLSFAIPTQAETSPELSSELRAVKSTNPFENISLEARAVYVLDAKTKAVLFARNENEKLPLASVTKIMTALVARDTVSESAVLTLTKDDLAAEGDSGLRSGERWRAGDILNVMLLVSSNDAAHAVAGFIGAYGQKDQNNNSDAKASRVHFVQMMNEKAHALGLTQMDFFNESGLDINETQNGSLSTAPATAGGYGSARDVAILFLELWNKYPETVEVTSRKDARIVSQNDIAHILTNTNEIIGRIPGLVASKTGYTKLAGGNLAVIFDRGIGKPVVVVILGSSYKGRFDDMEKVIATI